PNLYSYAEDSPAEYSDPTGFGGEPGGPPTNQFSGADNSYYVSCWEHPKKCDHRITAAQADELLAAGPPISDTEAQAERDTILSTMVGQLYLYWGRPRDEFYRYTCP